MKIDDSYIRPLRHGGMFAMTGPSEKGDRGFLPARGDLAHIKLAGTYFVPHYAVPMPHQVLRPIRLRTAADPGAQDICALPAGSVFNVLDIAGNWAWGQWGEDGQVGYLPVADLQAL